MMWSMGMCRLEAAEREYGVVIRYLGRQEQIVRPPEVYEIDLEATAALRTEKEGS